MPAARWWIDALCINQEDNDEKSQQIRMIATIYEKSQLVVVWLGLVDRHSDVANGLMRKVYSLQHAIQKVILLTTRTTARRIVKFLTLARRALHRLPPNMMRCLN